MHQGLAPENEAVKYEMYTENPAPKYEMSATHEPPTPVELPNNTAQRTAP